MQNDQSAQDAKRLLVAFSTNHAEAKMVSASEMVEPNSFHSFPPSKQA